MKKINVPWDEDQRKTPKAKLKADKLKGTIILNDITTARRNLDKATQG